jgi:hypothetical protein
VQTITLKLERRQIETLARRSKASGRSRSAVVRDLIERHLTDGAPSLHDQAQDLCGTVAGAKDSSTRPLKGYGRD